MVIEMNFELKKENLELRLSLMQAQAQILSLQNEKLEGVFKATKEELDALLNEEANNEANK